MNMRNLLFIFTVVLICSCSAEKIGVADTTGLAQFPKKWEKLTVIEKDTFVFIPCDAANRNISIYEKDNKLILQIEEGHETSFDTILNLNTRAQNSQYTIEVNRQYNSDAREYHIQFLKEQFLAEWNWKNSNGSYSEIFVIESDIGKYETVEQPCRECWDEYICDEK